MLLVFVLAIFRPPRGAMPETHQRYAESIRNGTFTCFNGEKTIPLSRMNDDHLDCSDGSDEPGTALNVGGKFYCANEGDTAKVINAWSVNDGICDCCDGSDEATNPRVKCPNTCGGVSFQIHKPEPTRPPLHTRILASLWKVNI